MQPHEIIGRDARPAAPEETAARVDRRMLLKTTAASVALAAPGRFGRDGGYGTSGYSDPKEDLVGILMTQRVWDSPVAPAVPTDFWTSAYQAIDD